MVAPIPRVKEQGEPEVRLRRGFFGKLIVQVRYPIFVEKYPSPGETGWLSGRAGAWAGGGTPTPTTSEKFWPSSTG
jgi:hypothetical protein